MSFEAFKIFLEFVVLITMGFFLLDILGVIKRGKKTRKWNKTEGEIIKNKVGAIFDIVGSSLNNYSAQVRYQYTVNSKIYESNKISLINESCVFRKKNDAKQFLKSFPVGKKIPVFYTSQKPEIAVLNPNDKQERAEQINFQIKIIFILLLFYIFIKILNLMAVW